VHPGITPEFDLDRLGDIPDPLQGRVESAPRRAALPADPSPTRGVVRWRRWAALSLSFAWVAGNLAAYGVRSDLSILPLGYVALEVAAPFALALVALVGAVHSGRFGLGTDRRIVSALTLTGPAAFAVLAIAGPAIYPEAFRNGALDGCLGCFKAALLWAAVPLALAGLTLRRAFVTGAGWRAALVGTSCGLLAGGTINLFCPNADPLHVIVGHGIPMLVTSVVGAVSMARWARA
jgi:hypothetical protein